MRVLLVLALTAAVALTGCKRNKPAPADSTPTPAAQGGGGGGGAIVPAGGIGVVVNPAAALGGGGGGGAVMGSLKAARRAEAQNELNTLGQMISFILTETGKMPTREQLLAELRQAPKLLAGINEGAYILTGSNEPGGLWAYEVDADTKPGIAVIGGRAARTTPEELAPYLKHLPKPAPTPAPGAPAAAPQAPTVQAAPAKPAANVVVSKQDLEDVRIFIDNASGASGRMPSVQEVYAALVQSGSPVAGLVQKQAIVITGAKTREGVWAFEYAAAERGGLACGPNGVETVTPAELKARLAATQR